jgi:chemotaxis protein methyltransferase CheR
MSVTAHVTDNITKLAVLSPLDTPQDQLQFIKLLDEDKTTPLEISFYESRTMPESVVHKLAKVLDLQKRSVRIFVYHSFLGFYLSKLQIPYTLIPSKPHNQITHSFKAIALGGSADSLDKIVFLIKHLPVSQTSVFIVQHVMEDKENLLDQLLKIHTDYAVVMPHHMEPVQSSTIYIAPSGFHMKVSNGMVYLTKDRKVNFARPSIDALFISLAYEYGSSLIAALLCGYGQDGVESLSILRQQGAVVIVEKSEECEAKMLTDTARQKGQYDYVLGLPEINSFLSSAVSSMETTDEQLDYFLEAVFVRYGYDFRRYQRTTIQRRIKRLMASLDCKDFYDFQKEVLTVTEVFERFFLELSINVTEFFRYPEQILYLREKIFPYLNSFPLIKIWSAGCSSGEEAYSLAIVLHELGMLKKAQIFATDINPYVIEEAKNGLFATDTAKNSQGNYRKSGGKSSLDNYFVKHSRFAAIVPHIKERVLCYTHSLVHDGVFNEFQLILCRNVLIYFQEELKQRVMVLFASSLHHDGFMVLGKDESIDFGSGQVFFEPEDQALKIYRLKHP